MATAAGDGSGSLDERFAGVVWFRRDWLDRRDIDPARAAVIQVRGESMEPALPRGCSILVDRSRTRWLHGHVHVLHSSDGIVVKRLKRAGDEWQLVSDHPAWRSIPQEDAVVLGEVRWIARSL